MAKPKIRIEAVDPEAGWRSRVILIDEDTSTETDISKVVYGIDLSIGAADGPNRVTLHCYNAMGTFEAELEDVVLQVIPPDRIPEVVQRLNEQYLGGKSE